MNLNKIIEEWVGNEQMHTIQSEYAQDGKPHETEYDRGHNDLVKDLKSRIPQLTERIVEEILNVEPNCTDEHEYQEKIIKSLTE